MTPYVLFTDGHTEPIYRYTDQDDGVRIFTTSGEYLYKPTLVKIPNTKICYQQHNFYRAVAPYEYVIDKSIEAFYFKKEN
jgi:hypothetical protein